MASLTEIRKQVEAIRAQLADLDSRPADGETIARAIRERCALQAEHFETSFRVAAEQIARDPSDVGELFRHSDTPRWMHSALIGLMGDVFIGRLIEQAQAAADAMGEGITPAERAKLSKALRRELYECELAEVAAARKAGATLRPDTNAAAVLGAPLDAAEEAGLI